MIDLATKYCMQQEIFQPTHGGEMLNLLFVNNHELISDISVEDWPGISDHRLVNAKTNFSFRKGGDKKVEQFLTETAKPYKKLNFIKAPWPLVEEELNKISWDNMEDISPSEALAAFHQKVLEVLELLVPEKPENPRIRVMKMQKLRRRL